MSTLSLPPGLARVMAATTLVVLSFSLLNPVLAVRLQTAGASSTAIGLFATLPFVAIAALVPLVPGLFRRIGVGRAYRLGLVLELLACLGYLLTDHFGLWCALGLMAGLGAAAAWNATEALIAHNVPATHRGRLTGLYQTLLGAGMALGPFLPALAGLDAREANALAAACLAVALALALQPAVLQLKAMHDTHAHMGLWSACRLAPSLVWAAVVGGVFEVGLGSVTVAHGSGLGLTLAAAASIAGALGMGSFLLQYPTGWLADRLPVQRLFGIASAGLFASALMLSQAPGWPALFWICAALWGAVGGALYTLTMIRVAHDFAHTSALAGTSAMIAGYTAGGAIGPLVSGWMIDHHGVIGQSGWLALLAASLWWMRPAQPAVGGSDDPSPSRG